MTFKIKAFKQAGRLLEMAGDRLYQEAAKNNLFLGLCERLVRKPDYCPNPLTAAVMDTSGVCQLTAIQTPPHNIVLAGWQNQLAALPTLTQYLKKRRYELPGVIGPAELANAVAKQWENLTGQPHRIAMYQRVYQLRQVKMPPMPEGCFEKAKFEDDRLLLAWQHAFHKETLDTPRELELERAQHLIQTGRLFFWKVDGKPVSMAYGTRPITGSITISGVFTPPEHRRRGYASACVARLSQHFLDQGYQSLTLFTDLANPTSNAIYQSIGFKAICDFHMIEFLEVK